MSAQVLFDSRAADVISLIVNVKFGRGRNVFENDRAAAVNCERELVTAENRVGESAVHDLQKFAALIVQNGIGSFARLINVSTPAPP